MVEDVEMMSQGEKGLVNISYRGSCAPGKNGSTPAAIWIMQFKGAVGMEVDCYRAALKLE